MYNNVYSCNQTIVSHSLVSFKVYCMFCNSPCLNSTFSKKIHVYTEISVWSWKFGLKSWKSIGQNMYEPCILEKQTSEYVPGTRISAATCYSELE